MKEHCGDMSKTALLGSDSASSSETSKVFCLMSSRWERLKRTDCRPRRSLLMAIFMTSFVSFTVIWYVFPQLASLNDIKCYFKLQEQAEWVLDNTPPTETVRILWFPETGSTPTWFQFRHLISLYSVYRFLQPMRIYIHHSSLPRQSANASHAYFHEWLPQAMESIPNLEFIHESQLAGTRSMKKIVETIASKWGASIIIQPNTLFDRNVKMTLSSPSSTSSSFNSPLDCMILDNYQLVVVRNRTSIQQQCIHVESNQGQGQGQSQSQSQSHGQSNGQGQGQGQLLLDTNLIGYVLDSDLQPEKHLVDNCTVSTIMRQLYYGTSELIAAQRHSAPVIPAIAHFVWFGRLDLSFLQMVAVWSVLTVGNVSQVYIHGDTPPEGVYWDELKATFKDRVLHHPVARPQTIYQVELTTCFQQSDTIRLDVLRLFGGFYVDFDIIITRSLQELFHYDAVIGPDWWGEQLEGYPLLNTAIVMSKPDSEYIGHLMNIYRRFSNTKWNYNCCILPRKVYQKHPQTVRVEQQLAYQVWFSSLRRDVNTRHSNGEWSRYYSYHYMRPDPQGLVSAPINRQYVDSLDTNFGDIVRLALYGSTELRSR